MNNKSVAVTSNLFLSLTILETAPPAFALPKTEPLLFAVADVIVNCNCSLSVTVVLKLTLKVKEPMSSSDTVYENPEKETSSL